MMSTNCLIKNPKQQQQQQTQNHHLHHHHHHHQPTPVQPPKHINKNLNDKLSNSAIQDWRCTDVTYWARHIECYSENVVACLEEESIDGQVLMELCEEDIRNLRFRLNYPLTIGEIKKLWLSIRLLQQINTKTILRNCICDESSRNVPVGRTNSSNAFPKYYSGVEKLTPTQVQSSYSNNTLASTPLSKELSSHSSAEVGLNSNASAQQQCIPPDIFKTMLSLGYSFVVTWITSFVMVIVHERVPDMKRYPPLPDIFLDNVPHIPWAFHMCEITGTLLFMIWTCVCIFHKHRMVLLRRFFALAGTVFLLRCVTMLITSLSVPGTHLQCNQKDYAVDDTSMAFLEALHLRVSRAYAIWSGLGMSIQGVRTCGDYMFSGHTVALTLLNFFITEYTPRNLYFLHTMTWLLNMFGIFFILAAHEHYSIDVFVAFYITSRLFLYYHTLANNQALMSRDSNRTRIWFPMFSYFESSVEGIIPNEYDTLGSLFDKILYFVFSTVDSLLLRARNFWFESTKLGSIQKKVFAFSLNNAAKPLATNTATNTTPVTSNSKPFAQVAAATTVSSQAEDELGIQKEFQNINTEHHHDSNIVKKKL